MFDLETADPAALPVRTCSTCGNEYFLGSAKICATCREKARVRRAERRAATRPTGRGITGSTTPSGSRVAHDAIVDMSHAVDELQKARDELSSLPDGLTKYQRFAITAEPLARVDLVRRYCVDMLARYGWRP